MSRPRWTTGERGRFLVASAAGALAALLLFTLLVTRGEPTLTQWQRSGDFYDAQAHAWLAGNWEIRDGILNIEKFLHDDEAYMYQGPWPALLRVPVAAVTDRYDGRLTQLSMILAAAVAMAGATRLHWRVRRIVRPGVPLDRRDVLVAGLATFTVGGGSALLYEASRAWVYQEAAMWGAAWSIVAIDAVVGCALGPTRRRVAWAGLVTTLAMCSRSSVALGAVAALAILTAGNLIARVAQRRSGGPGLLGALRWAASAPRRDGRLPVLGPALATLTPVAVYATVNYIKFATLFSIPFWQQGFTIEDPQRQEFLAVNGGTLFGLKWVPTTVVQYLRPDALRFTSIYPFVDFPPPARPFSGVEFDLIDTASSIPSSMPLLTVLGLVGAVALLRARPEAPGAGVAVLRGPALGALAGALTILPFAYIANRYLADAVPVLLLTGLVGIHRLLARRPHATRPHRWRALWAGLGVLLLASVWINVSLALIFGRLYSSDVKDDVAAEFLDTRYDVAQSIGLDPAIPLRDDERLPVDAPRGQIAIVGDCDAMYLSDALPLNAVKQTPWNPLVRSEAGGRYLRTVTFPFEEPGTRRPVFTFRSPEGDGQLHAEWRGGAGVVFEYEGPGHGFSSPVLYIPADRTYTMDLVVDPRMQQIHVWLDDVLMFQDKYTAPVGTEIHLATDVLDDPLLEDTWAGRFDPRPERNVGLCRELRREAGG